MNHSPEATLAPTCRKRLTYREKLSILDGLERGEFTAAGVCAKYHLHRNTLPNWRKAREKMKKIVEEECQSERKRAMVRDPLSRIRSGLEKFYNENNAQPDSLKIPLTRKFVLIMISIS